MGKELLSVPWIEEYGLLWNETPAIRTGIADLSVTIVYRVAEDPETRKAELEVKEGEVIYAGPARTDAPDFTLTAKADVWRQFGFENLRAQKAIILKKLKFEGPMMVALTHLGALEAALQLFGRVEDTEWA